MDQYIEELNIGNTFVYKNATYIMTQDFRKNGDRLCVNLLDGSARWIGSTQIVEETQIYRMDSDNNFMPLSNHKNIPPNIQNKE
jgi:hypothetical protein